MYGPSAWSICTVSPATGNAVHLVTWSSPWSVPTVIGAAEVEAFKDEPWAGTNAIWNYERWWGKPKIFGHNPLVVVRDGMVPHGGVTSSWPYYLRLKDPWTQYLTQRQREQPVKDQAKASVPASWRYPFQLLMSPQAKEDTRATERAVGAVTTHWPFPYRHQVAAASNVEQDQPVSDLPVANVTASWKYPQWQPLRIERAEHEPVQDQAKASVPAWWAYGVRLKQASVNVEQEQPAQDQAPGTTPQWWKYAQWWPAGLVMQPASPVSVVILPDDPKAGVPAHWLYPQWWGQGPLVQASEHEPFNDFPWAGTNPIWNYERWKPPKIIGTSEHEPFPDEPTGGTNDLWVYQQLFTQRGMIGALPNDPPTFPPATAQPPMVLPAHWPYAQNFALLGPIGRGEPTLAKEVAINASVTGHWMYAQNWGGNPLLLLGMPGTGNPPVVVVVTNHLLYIMGLGT